MAEPEEGDALFPSEPAASANEFDHSDLYDYFKMGQMIADFESDLYGLNRGHKLQPRDAILAHGGGITPERNLAPTFKVAKMPTAPLGETESHRQRYVDFNLGIPAMIARLVGKEEKEENAGGRYSAAVDDEWGNFTNVMSSLCMKFVNGWMRHAKPGKNGALFIWGEHLASWLKRTASCPKEILYE